MADDKVYNLSDWRTSFEGYSDDAFLMNEFMVHEPIIAFPDFFGLWKPRSVLEITPESLAWVLPVKSSVEILLIGTGNGTQQLPRETSQWLSDNKVAYEVMSTSSAFSTFCFLMEEDRQIAAALLLAGATSGDNKDSRSGLDRFFTEE